VSFEFKLGSAGRPTDWGRGERMPKPSERNLGSDRKKKKKKQLVQFEPNIDFKDFISQSSLIV
jgi:hypothetical protein